MKVFLLTVVIALAFLVAQTTDLPKKSTRKEKAPATRVAKKKPKADRLAAAARADSLRQAQQAKVLADSLQRQRLADSLGQLKKDSVSVFHSRVIKNEAFGVGETLVYEVNYGFITAGEAVMAVTRYDTVAGRKAYRVEFTVNSLPSFSWIYKVEDLYRTFIDVEWLAPLRFEQHIREGTYRRDFVADFDQVRSVATTTEGQYPIPPYVHDIMSAFYFARTLDFGTFRPGDGVMLSNFYKDKTHDLMVKFLGRQELEVEAGKFRTLVVEPLVKEGGLFKSEGRIVIWVTDDELKVPVRVNTKVVIGSIDTELKAYSGLVGPVGARIE